MSKHFSKTEVPGLWLCFQEMGKVAGHGPFVVTSGVPLYMWIKSIEKQQMWTFSLIMALNGSFQMCPLKVFYI